MRLFDRRSGDIRIEPSAVEWIREHEPRQLHLFEMATLRNARFALWAGRIMLIAALGFLAQMLLIASRYPETMSPVWYVISGLGAGLGLAGGQHAAVGARFWQLLAVMKGEGIRSGPERPA
jgi:hypothetical protein